MVSLAQIIAFLYPTARPLVDYTVTDEGAGAYLSAWNTAALGPAPTDVELEAHRAEVEASVAAGVTPGQNAAQQAAARVFNALSAGKQALWEPVRAAVDVALAAGDLPRAAAIIQTVPEIYDGMEADRAAFLALFAAPAAAA